jgi:L-Lysine epsilon oxidase N-terminal/L-lysine epsilon oxidase C-terminal domain
MPPVYRIHPGVGVARLGNSPDSFYLAPERAAQLPIECDEQGNPRLSPDGEAYVHVKTFKDAEGRVRRQAARFQVWVYDDESPEGRPLKLEDTVEGGGNAGKLVDIQWRVWLANKKAVWYQFQQLEGEHGYLEGHPRRNPQVTGPARQRLIIDPGPRTVDCKKTRRAAFDRDGGADYAPTFPPAELQPHSIDTLGELITDDEGRLLVLGGHGHSGSYLYDEFGQPRIDEYANNDGWFDDTSDGPVMARLVMFSSLVQDLRFIDVEAPAWVLCGYPGYVPEILDIVTMEDVVEDVAVTQFAERTDLYGTAGTFHCPERIAPTDEGALIHWRAGRLRWNPEYKPWFFRDVWPILFRPDQFSYLCDVLGQSNYPHNYSTRGTFDPTKLGVPPRVFWPGVRACQARCLRRHHNGEVFVETLAPTYLVLEREITAELQGSGGTYPPEGFLTPDAITAIQKELNDFANDVDPQEPGDDFDAYVARWKNAGDPKYVERRAKLEDAVANIIEAIVTGLRLGDDLRFQVRRLTLEHVRRFLNGGLLDGCRAKCIEANTVDLHRSMRHFLFSLIRKPGEENDFVLSGKASSRVHNLPLMPLLAGDNPISNDLPSKFLRLTEYQYYILRQWATGMFYNEQLEGWPVLDPLWPYVDTPPKTARELDRGAMANVLGGAFCPGGEAGWVMRNPAIWREPYRIKADLSFSTFGQTGAQANFNHGKVPELEYSSYTAGDLSQDNDFDTGLQPGDLTKYMALPWQSDFNECSTQTIDVTYSEWNQINYEDDQDSLLERQQRTWETLWWPAHRPLQTFEVVDNDTDNPLWLDWSPGVPQTYAGDLKMVSEWWRLPFVIRNPAYASTPMKPTAVPPPSPAPYFSIERTKRK